MASVPASADGLPTPSSIENETRRFAKFLPSSRRISFENEKTVALGLGVKPARGRTGRVQSCLDAFFRLKEPFPVDDFLPESPTLCRKSRLPYRVSTGKGHLKARTSRTRSDSYLTSRSAKISSLPSLISLPKRRKTPAKLRATAQLDGSLDDQGASDESHDASEECHSMPTPPDSSPDLLNLRRRKNQASHHSVDLTPPNNSALSDPFSPYFGTPTSLTQADPAPGDFPFPTSEKTQSVLSPFTPWASRSRLRPTPKVSAGSRSFSYSPSQSPDRFLPRRRPGSTRESYELIRSPDRLTESEKLARTKEVGPDPFGRRIRSNASRFISRLRPTASHSVPNTSPAGANSVHGFRRNSTGSEARVFSNGAIWIVGGAHAASGDNVYAVSDGRGGMLASGTNAPLHSANFLNRVEPDIERDAHERRLALALDVDTSSRIMELSTYSSVNSSLNNISGLSSSPARTVWKDNEWTKEGSVARLLLSGFHSRRYLQLCSTTKLAETEKSSSNHSV